MLLTSDYCKNAVAMAQNTVDPIHNKQEHCTDLPTTPTRIHVPPTVVETPSTQGTGLGNSRPVRGKSIDEVKPENSAELVGYTTITYEQPLETTQMTYEQPQETTQTSEETTQYKTVTYEQPQETTQYQTVAYEQPQEMTCEQETNMIQTVAYEQTVFDQGFSEEKTSDLTSDLCHILRVLQSTQPTDDCDDKLSIDIAAVYQRSCMIPANCKTMDPEPILHAIYEFFQAHPLSSWEVAGSNYVLVAAVKILLYRLCEVFGVDVRLMKAYSGETAVLAEKYLQIIQERYEPSIETCPHRSTRPAVKRDRDE